MYEERIADNLRTNGIHYSSISNRMALECDLSDLDGVFETY